MAWCPFRRFVWQCTHGVQDHVVVDSQCSLRKTVPASSSSLISPALEQVAELPAGERDLLVGGCASLAEYLAQVPDPRDPRGLRHTLTSLLLAAVAAVLAGHGPSPRSANGSPMPRPRSLPLLASAVMC